MIDIQIVVILIKAVKRYIIGLKIKKGFKLIVKSKQTD